MNIACSSNQNATRIKRFLRLHIVIKPAKTIKTKTYINKFFIILKRNSINVHLSTWPQFAPQIGAFVVKSENWLAV